jgi:hypothetical protein
MPDDYASQVARMRQERRQQELDTDYRQAVVARETALQERQRIEQEAAGVDAGDTETRQALTDEWYYHDAELRRAEADLQRLNPPQPQLSPQQQEFMRRAQPYVRKGGQQALNNIAQAHARALAVGLRENTQPYFDHIRANLELNGGAQPEDTQELTPLEAAKASGLSWNEYAKQAQKYQDMKRRGEI